MALPTAGRGNSPSALRHSPLAAHPSVGGGRCWVFPLDRGVPPRQLGCLTAHHLAGGGSGLALTAARRRLTQQAWGGGVFLCGGAGSLGERAALPLCGGSAVVGTAGVGRGFSLRRGGFARWRGDTPSSWRLGGLQASALPLCGGSAEGRAAQQLSIR